MLIYDLAFDVYPPDDPAGKVSNTGTAARLCRLTLDDQLVDGEYLAELFGTGSGFLEIHVDNPDADFLQKRGYVMVVRMTGTPWLVEEPIGGFWLSRGFLKALSGSEQKGRVVRWEGEGPSDGLDRYNLGHSVYATGQTKRGDVTVPGLWRWNDEPYGAILVRILEEGFDHPAGFYNFFDWDFDRGEDTNGNDWEVLSDYETPIGTGGLKLWADFLRLGLVAEVSPDLTIHAYRDLDEYRTDRSSATFSANKVRFEAGVNIIADLLKRLNASSQRTHVLYEDRTGDYETIDEDIDNNPIDGVPYMTYRKSTTTADDDAIRRMGRQFLTKLDQNVDVARVTHLVGPGGIAGETGYLPSPTGDYWLGDLVTIHTGTTEYDFNEQTIEVAAIRYFVTGSQWMVEAELGAQYRNIQQQNIAGQIAQTVINQQNILLCQANESEDVGRVNLLRLYYSNGAAAYSPAVSAGWDVDDSGSKILKTTADGTFTSSHSTTSSATGQAGGKNICKWQGVYGPLDSTQAAAIAAGGLTVRSQFRARTRYGIGINEAAQDIISNIGVRVTTGASTTIRGVALAPHTEASSAGSSKWPAQATKVNKQDPPAAVSGVLSAVGGTAAGDYLVVEIGARNYTTVTSGFAINLNNSESGDLPEDDASTLDLNAWIDLYTAGSATPIAGDGRVELVGTSVKAKRCDDTEHWHAEGSSQPTVTDDVDAGFRNGTLWINDDGAAWLLIDNAAGEADWLAVTGALTDHDHTGTGDGGELDGGLVADYLEFTEASAPSTPATGLARLYVKSDGRFYSKDEGGTEYGPFDAAGGATPAVVSGGTETDNGTYQWNAFTSNGTLTVSSSGLADVLVVGGGGGGGSYYSGGGGGAGDVLFLEQVMLEAGTYAAVIGAGGAGGTATTATGTFAGYGTCGAPSKLGSRMVASGGGAGLPEGSDYLDGSGGTTVGNVKMMGGASSGGGGGRIDNIPGLVTGGGFSGGSARSGGSAGTGAGGGGGGASAVGGTGTSGNVGGDGGAGLTVTEFSAFGASGVFGGGGGGGGVTTGGAGGSGGGGHGGGTSANTGQTAATANTGGGGGGGGNTSTTGATGSAGGSGVVIIRTEL